MQMNTKAQRNCNTQFKRDHCICIHTTKGFVKCATPLTPQRINIVLPIMRHNSIDGVQVSGGYHVSYANIRYKVKGSLELITTHRLARVEHVHGRLPTFEQFVIFYCYFCLSSFIKPSLKGVEIYVEGQTIRGIKIFQLCFSKWKLMFSEILLLYMSSMVLLSSVNCCN